MKYIKAFENMDQAKSIISKKMNGFDLLKDLLKNNLGYIGKFTEYLFDENVPYKELENLYKDLKYLSNKNNPININEFSYEKLLDIIEQKKNTVSINTLINQFPSEQKKMAKELINSNKSFYNALLQLSKSQDDNKAFISKISRYKNEDSLEDALYLFSKKGIKSKEDVKNFISDKPKTKISFENEDILIVNIIDYKDIKELGSDTSWCIVSSESTFDRYLDKGNRAQYILFDYTKDEFDPKFKIGFTISGEGNIYAAHDTLDKTYSKQLRDIFNKYEVDVKKLAHKIEPIEFVSPDLSKIKGNMTSTSLFDIIEKCPTKDLKSLAKKIGETRFRSSSNQENGVRKCLTRLYRDKEYIIVEDDLDPIDEHIKLSTFMNYNWVEDKLIYRKKLTMRMREDLFVMALQNIWIKDVTILSGISLTSISYEISPDSNKRKGYSTKTIETLYTRLFNIYKSGIDFSKIVNIDSNKTYKRNILGSLYLLDRYLGKNTKELEYIYDEYKLDLDRYNNILKKQISLYDLKESKYNLELGDVDYIIKQDYTDFDKTPIISNYEFKSFYKLIKHLEGYELCLRINKSTYNEILDRRLKELSELSDLKNIFEQISKVTRKMPGKIYKSRKLSIKWI